MTPLKAIRLKCLDCCVGSSAEVKLCPIKDCSLYNFRFGKNPFIKRKELSEEHLLKLKQGREKHLFNMSNQEES